MKTVYVTVGPPGAGKSTWAKKEVFKRQGQIKRINKDTLREMFDNGVFDMRNEGYVTDMRDRMVEAALERGYDVIIDDTNLSTKHFNVMCDIAKRVGDVRVVEILFPIDVKTALRRNEEREATVPEHIVRRMVNKYNSRSSTARDEYFGPVDVNQHWVDHMFRSDKQSAYIFDLDGTLALNNHGRSYYDWKDVINDDVNYAVVDVAKALSETGAPIIIVTGRDGSCKQECIDWLDTYEIPYDYIYTRKANDTRKDSVVKGEIYDEYIKPNFWVAGVFDDRKQVVDFWRTKGIPVFQVANGDF